MGYAFISYSSKNQSSADAMRKLFKKNNIDTWMAPYDIPAGSKYAAVITKAIRNCSCFVLLLSNDSQASEAVDSEVELATLTFKKSIITVELEKVILNDAFTFYIHNKHIIAVHKIDENSLEVKKVLDAVRAYTGECGETKITFADNNETPITDTVPLTTSSQDEVSTKSVHKTVKAHTEKNIILQNNATAHETGIEEVNNENSSLDKNSENISNNDLTKEEIDFANNEEEKSIIIA